jgi:HEAT repeat protein
MDSHFKRGKCKFLWGGSLGRARMKRIAGRLCAGMGCVLLLYSLPVRGVETPLDQAWNILQANLREKSVEKRVRATHVLGLLPGDRRALRLAETSALDEKPEVRAAAAAALGQMPGKSAAATLHKLLSDDEPSVVLAAASALVPSKDPAAYEAYYQFLTGERKTGPGLIASQMKTLKDPKKMAEIGVEQGIGFLPYAGIGLEAFKTLREDDVSPVRAAAAKMLANDPDPQSAGALVKAASDKSWVVRAAALEAIARRGDPQLLDSIVPALMDENLSVKCTAAAAIIRLSTLQEVQNKNAKAAN